MDYTMTVTPEQFAALASGICPECGSPVTITGSAFICAACGAVTPDDYFVVNKETGKLELHFAKETYDELTDAQRADIKHNFLWGRKTGCWISRAKEPNLHYAKACAQRIGLTDAGSKGSRLSFADQQTAKAERAERRAERYDALSASEMRECDRLQKPLNDRRGDIAFYTQPNINTSSGRAFTRQRDKMIAAFDKGFEHFKQSEYYADRAEAARQTAAQKELKDKGFINRRIRECEKNLRAIKRNIEHYEGNRTAAQEGKLKHYDGTPFTVEQLEEQLAHWDERMEAELDKLSYYTAALDALGGVAFSRENIKPGMTVKISRWGGSRFKVLSAGPKNIKAVSSSNIPLTFAYAEIISVEPEQE